MNFILQYTTGKYEISRRENRCILKIKNAGKEDHNAEFACTVEGDKTACVVTVEGQTDFLLTSLLLVLWCIGVLLSIICLY